MTFGLTPLLLNPIGFTDCRRWQLPCGSSVVQEWFTTGSTVIRQSVAGGTVEAVCL